MVVVECYFRILSSRNLSEYRAALGLILVNV